MRLVSGVHRFTRMMIRIVLLASLGVVGCETTTPPEEPPPDMAQSKTLGAAPSLARPCNDGAASVYELPAGLPPMDNSRRGEVFRCAVGESLSATHANARARALGYPGATLPSGFWTYRIAFRSLRAADASSGATVEGDMAAVLALPEKPLPGAPLVVFGHPTVGIAPSCATSRIDLSDEKILNDYSAAVIPLAAYGYTVIVPDYVGYSYGQPPGYFNAEDEAHAMLDSTRAAAKLLTSSMGFDKVVFVGHSQGGHAALSAQHYAASYGMSGKLIGVATYAPYWTTMASFGAITSPLASFNTTKDSYAISFAMFYFYAQGELRDGVGMGTSVFQPAKRDLVRQTLVGNDICYDFDNLKKLGHLPNEFFEPAWVDAVGTNCALLNDCSTADSMKWSARWKRDRPALDPNGAPVLVWYGGKDQNISLGLAQCARNRFAADLAGAGATVTVSYCFDPDSNHNTIPRVNAGHVNQWIAARAGLGSEPAPCAQFPAGQSCMVPPQDL
jgi:pimeloyl-ACP methyl ester carboxylesterase